MPPRPSFWHILGRRLKAHDYADTCENFLITFVVIDVLDTIWPTPLKERPERFQKLHPKRPTPHEVLAQRKQQQMALEELQMRVKKHRQRESGSRMSSVFWEG
ncbi:MAG: hypothetical protein M1830_001452, partial [Pleopsidium flavum]